MRHIFPSAFLVALGSSLLAQSTQNYYVSPPGTETLEGGSSSTIMLGQAQSQVQQIDDTLKNIASPVIKALAFRRNANLTTAAVHTIEMEIKIGHSNFATVGTTYSANYLGAPTIAFQKQKVQMDWTAPSPLTPAAYDVVFTFGSPFLYNLKDALVWESNNTTGTANSGYNQDWYSGTSPATIYGPIPSVLGTGCTTPNGAMQLTSSFRSGSATTFDFGFGIAGGPASQSVLLFVGVANPNVPLFCGTLRVDPLLSAPLGATSATGGIALQYASTAWSSTLANAAVFTQAFALDGSQASGVAMSNGLHSRAPRVPGGAGPYAIKRIYTQNAANTTTGSTPSLSCVATKYL